MSAAAPVPAREWFGSPFEWVPPASLQAGDPLRACFALAAVQLLRTRQDKPYLRLSLVDRNGPIEGRMWDDAERAADALSAGAYVGVRGRVEVFNNERQIKVEEIAPLVVELEDLVHFLPRAPRPIAEMEAELDRVVAGIEDPALRELLGSIFAPGNELGRGFKLAPAAKQNHHACIGGLLEHSLSVATVCDTLARHYGPDIDRDLLLTAALLHDIGKVREIGAQPGFPYTDEGKLLGHILIGLQLVADAARQVAALPPQRLLLLQHLIASHQGRYEWQSPREPRILEGLILHYADDLDAKMNQAAALVARVETGWTAYDRSFARDFLRHRPPDEEPAADARAEQRETSTRGRPPKPPQPEPEPTSPAANGRWAEDSLDLFGAEEDEGRGGKDD